MPSYGYSLMCELFDRNELLALGRSHVDEWERQIDVSGVNCSGLQSDAKVTD